MRYPVRNLGFVPPTLSPARPVGGPAGGFMGPRPALSPAVPTPAGSMLPRPPGGYAPGSGLPPYQQPPPPGGPTPGSGLPPYQKPPPPGGYTPGAGLDPFQLPLPPGGPTPGSGADPFVTPPPPGGYTPGSGADPYWLPDVPLEEIPFDAYASGPPITFGNGVPPFGLEGRIRPIQVRLAPQVYGVYHR